MVAHVVCIRARWRRDHAKSHAVIPPCMAQINDLSSCRKIHNILISRTLGLNLMPFGSWPHLVTWSARAPQRGKYRNFPPGEENDARLPNHPGSPRLAKSHKLFKSV